MNDPKKFIEKYQKVHWLSYWQMATMCNSLEFVIVFVCNVLEDGFVVDITRVIVYRNEEFQVHLLSLFPCRHFTLSFDNFLVEVWGCGSYWFIINAKIVQLGMLFVTKTVDLNTLTFSGDTRFNILLD